jgi:hypothetical protein
MTQITELATPAPTRGRQIKFTPEKIQQIKNLVERGKTREEIAELIGVTVGSLQVTCSRLSISLRRPTFNKAIGVLRRDDARFSRVSAPGSNASAGALLQLTKEALERNSRPASVKPEAAPCQECGNRANEAAAASFAIRMQYRGEERTTELPLTQDMIGHLSFEAAFRNVSIGELIDELIVAVVKQDLLQTVLERKEADEDRYCDEKGL